MKQLERTEINMTKPLALVIEDDPEISNVISLSLMNDFEIELIRTGDKALSRLAQIVPLLIILDLHLPGVSGLDIFSKIRATSNFDNTKVILCTADALQAISLRDKADVIMLKPIKPSALRDLAIHLVNAH